MGDVAASSNSDSSLQLLEKRVLVIVYRASLDTSLATLGLVTLGFGRGKLCVQKLRSEKIGSVTQFDAHRDRCRLTDSTPKADSWISLVATARDNFRFGQFRAKVQSCLLIFCK